MFTRQTKLIRASVLLLLALFVGSGIRLNAQQVPEAPYELSYTLNHMNSNDVAILWQYGMHNSNNYHADNFNIYLATGNTTDMQDFTLMSTYSSDSCYVIKRQMYAAPLYLTPGVYSVYVTAVRNGLSSVPSEIIVINTLDGAAKFTSTPPTTGKIGVNYAYTMTAESFDPLDSFTYTLTEAPAGAVIDPVTNTISWTPQESGLFRFEALVTGSNSNAFDYDSWTVYIKKCDIGAKISGTVKDKKGNLIDNGTVYLWRTDITDSSKYYPDYPVMDSYEYELTDGTYSFNDIDEGEYILVAQGMDFYTDWNDSVLTKSFNVVCGQNLVKDIVVKRFNYNDYVKITSQPIEYAIINQPYSYQIEASSNSNSIINYELSYGPQDAVLDVNTGLLTWTPIESGEYTFEVKAYLNDDEDVSTSQWWTVRINECAVPAVLTFNINYDDGTPVHEKAGAYLISNMDSATTAKPIKYYFSEIINGQAVFNNIDKGTYYMAVDLWSYKDNNQIWYEGTDDFTLATPIYVDCGDSLTFAMTIDKPAVPEYKTVSGSVSRQADNTPVANALVEFFGQGYRSYAHAVTDAYGNYEIKVLNNCKYIARASYNDTLNWMQSDLMPIYYDGKTNATDAEQLEIGEGLTNINFHLPARPVYANAMNGTVLRENGTAVENAKIVAFLTDVDPSIDYSWIYTAYEAQSNISGDFSFSNLMPGKYVLLVYDEDGTFIPGYYFENDVLAWDWANATQITMNETSIVSSIAVTVSDTVTYKKGHGKIKGAVGKHGKKAKICTTILGKDDAITGANVYAVDENGKTVKTIRTSSNGNFEFTDMAKGKYTIQVDKIGYSSTIGQAEIKEEGGSSTVDFNLDEKVSGVDEYPTVSLSVAPNPVNDFMNLNFETSNDRVTIQIVNTLGNEVMSLNYNTVSGSNNVSINTATLPVGAYSVIIRSGSSFMTAPIIISR